MNDTLENRYRMDGPEHPYLGALVGLGVVAALCLSSRLGYLLFHSLVEVMTIAIAFTLFILTWHTRRFLINGCLKVLGIGYGFVAGIDMLHTLSYKGMGVFPAYDANLPTQLWIAARYLQATVLLAAPLYTGRNIDMRFVLAISLAAVSVSTGLVFSGVFPDCFIEGKGLTPFKIISEYIISAFLLAALILFIGKRSAFNPRVFRLIIVSILCTIFSELAFTSYVSVYGPANMAGHFLKLASFVLIYRALVVTGFKEPFDLIFRDMKQVQDILTQQREFNRCLLDSMADGVVACDAYGTLTLFNRTARQWHGLDQMCLPPEEWAQHYNLFRADGATPLPAEDIPLALAFKGEVVKDAGMAIVAEGQAPRFILANGSVVMDASGHKLGAVVIMHDITAFRRLEQELVRANEDLERRVVERTAELENTAGKLNEAQRMAGIGSWELDLTANVLTWSDEIYRMFEIDPEKSGASYEVFLDAIHPDDREAVNAAYTNSLSTRTPYAIDHRLLFPDGRVKFVHEQCETFYENDKPVRSVGTVQDITERKMEEDSLRRSEEALRIREALLNESQRVGQVGGWDWDAVRDVIWWSDEYYRIYGFEPGTPPPNYVEHLKAYTPESAERLDAAVKRAMELGEPYELDLELANPTPMTRWIVARCEVKRDEKGSICGLRGTAHNITERKIAEEELRRLNDELDQRVRERTAELEKANKGLERLNNVFVGRELRMVELKKRIKELEFRLDQASNGDTPQRANSE